MRKELLLFEDLDWDPRTKGAQDQHCPNIAKYYSSAVKQRILQG